MKIWEVELTIGGKIFAEAKIQRGIYQGDALSPLIFVMIMKPHNHLVRKSTAGSIT